MTVYSLSAWNWRRPTLPEAEARSSVSYLWGRLQEHLPVHLLYDKYGDGASLEQAGQAAAGVILPAGNHLIDSPSIRGGVAARHRSRQVVTVLQSPNNQLALTSWRVNADGSVIQTGTGGPQPDQVAQVELARAGKFVVAYRSTTQQLKLVSWDVSNTGAIYRAGESEPWPERVRRVRLCAVNDQVLVTVCVTRTRRLKLISWRLGEDATLTPCAEISGSALDVREVAAVMVAQQGDHPQIATVLRVGTGQLVVQVWRVSRDGLISPGPLIALSAVATNLQAIVDNNGHLITAMRTATGRLRLIGWLLADNGETLKPLFDTGEGAESIRNYRILPVPGGVVTAIATTDNHLKLIRWQLAVDGAYRRLAESQAEPAPIGPLLVCAETLDGNAPLFTCVRTPQGLFQVRTWRM